MFRKLTFKGGVHPNDNKNHTITEHNKITVPALFKNPSVFSNTSRPTYLNDGNLYSGSSKIKVLNFCFIKNLLII